MGFDTPTSPRSPIDRPNRVNSMDSEDYSWTGGGDKSIAHQKLIAVGGYGEVHQV
jgi:hypothetical protein